MAFSVYSRLALAAAVAFVCAPAFSDEPVSTPLLEAVYADDTPTAVDLIESGSDVNAANRYGVVPLVLACQNGNGDIVSALLRYGANPDAKTGGGESALMIASRTGKLGPVELLLKEGASLETTERKGQTALMWAAAEGHDEVVDLLIRSGAEPEERLKSGFTAIHFAARNGHLKTVESLLDAGVSVGDVIAVDKVMGKSPPKGTTPLRLAVENGHFDLASYLIERGADPNEQLSGFAPLHILTWVRKPHRGDGDNGLPPPKTRGTLTSLAFAKKIVEEYGAEVNLRLESGSAGGSRFGTRGASPFLLAAQRADLDYMKLLESFGANVLLPNADGTTPFLAAAGVGSSAPEEEAGNEAERLDVLPWILERGADVNVKNRFGDTAMHGAAYKNVPEVVHFLDASGADITLWNTKNKKRWTPLLIAQGFRPGNFKPSQATIDAIETVMRSHGIDPPAAPERPVIGAPKKYVP